MKRTFFCFSLFFLASSLFAAKWWDVYFTAGDDTLKTNSTLEQFIKNFMDCSSSNVDIANYSWGTSSSNEVVLSANLLNPGVPVRIVGDGDKGFHPDLEASISKVSDSAGDPIMHNKFIIRDTATANAGVMTGSGNYTEGAWSGQNNTYLFLYSTGIAKMYENEFNEMFVDGNFQSGAATVGNPLPNEGWPSDVEVNVYFNPEDEVAQDSPAGPLFTRYRDAAESVFWEFTGYNDGNSSTFDLDTAVLDPSGPGANHVLIEGVYNSMGVNSLNMYNGDIDPTAGSWFVEVRKSSITAFDKHHHKYMVFDMDWVWVGSANASKSSIVGDQVDNSDENGVLIKDFRLAREFVKEFHRNYHIGYPVGAEDNTSVTPSLTHDDTPPDAPTTLIVSLSGNAFNLSWTSPADPGDFSRYYIFISSYHTTSNSMNTAKEQTTDGEGGHKSCELRPEVQKKGISATSATVSTYNEGDALVAGENYYIGVVAVDKWCNESTLLFSGPHLFKTDTTPPVAISNLTALIGTTVEGTITLKWTAPGDDGTGTANVSSYLIKYADRYIGTNDFYASWVSTYSQNWTPADFGTEDGASGNRVISGLSPGVTYWFAIKAKDAADNWGSWTSSGTDSSVNYSNCAVAYDTNPAVPTGLSAVSVSSSEIKINWNANSEADFKEYILDFSSYSSAAGWQNLVSTTSTTVYHSNLMENNTYYYRVRASDVNGYLSDWSSSVNVFPYDISPPAAPSNFSGIAQSTTAISWSWTDNSSNEDGFTFYAGGLLYKLSANTTEYQETGLFPNTSYYRYAEAYNASGSSASAPSTVYTLANPPTDASFSSVGFSSLTFSWNSNSNPAMTVWEIFRSTDNFSTSTTTLKDFSDGYTSTAYTDSSLSPNTTYWYKIRAFNGDGIQTEFILISTNTLGQVVNPGDVVFNEIAWMGTSSSTVTDEWIELYNTTSQNIVMVNWAIYVATEVLVSVSGTIGANSYYLIERTDDTTVSDISADQTPTGWGSYGLSNNGEKLQLKDASGNVIDLVDCSSGWFAGSASPDYYTMEKKNPTYDGNVASSWASNNGTTRNGLDADGSPINGTPRSQNSVYETGSSDTTPPAAVSDLTASTGGAGAGSITLSWTAPGDDGNSGTATLYDIRISSTGNITSSNFSAVALVSDFVLLPSPSSAGTSETLIVTGLSEGVTYWFAIKTADEVPNLSSWNESANPNNSAYALPWSPADAAKNVYGTAYSTSAIMWSWTDAVYEDGYDIYSSTGGLLAALSENVTFWIQTGLSPDTSSQITIVSWNSRFVGLQTSSSTVSANAPFTYQTPPQSAATPYEVSTSSAIIYWQSQAGIKYRVERDGVFVATVTATGSTASYIDANVYEGISYSYDIYSVNSDGNWNSSEGVSIDVTVPAAAAEGEPTGPHPGFVTKNQPLIFGSEVEKITIYSASGEKLMEINGREWNGTLDNSSPSSAEDMFESGAYIYRVKTTSGKIKYGTAVIVK
ncbi:MAG: fibronectin type III domain-containing protein [Elusimicrobia bacterium]|nr:fibronectin type III domain-containing protein [Elusimicrobiota bacterium]